MNKKVVLDLRCHLLGKRSSPPLYWVRMLVLEIVVHMTGHGMCLSCVICVCLSAILAPATAEVTDAPAEEDVSIAAADAKADEESSAPVANEANTALDFFSALEERNVDLVAEMVEQSPALLEQLSADGDPPLVIAADDLDMTKKLLELGANVNSKTSGGESALSK